MIVSSVFYRSLFFSCVVLLTRQVICEEISRCYDDVNICLWTDDSDEQTHTAAQSTCQRRSNSFLPRITNDSIQNKLRQFRREASSLLGTNGFWTDVHAVSISSSFHWIDGSELTGQVGKSTWSPSASVKTVEPVSTIRAETARGSISIICQDWGPYSLR